MSEDDSKRQISIASALENATLTTTNVEFDYDPVAVMPEVKVLKIGGQSIMDRGRVALFPILEEIVANKDRYHMLLCCGGGTRARHIYAVGSDLEMPTGVLAAMGGYVPRQNARMVQMLLAKHGGIFIIDDDFVKLPLYFQVGCLPITTGMPPFSYWEKPGRGGRIPANRTDAGVFLSAEFLGRQGRSGALRRRPEEELQGEAHPAHFGRRVARPRSARPGGRARRHRVPDAGALLQRDPDHQRHRARHAEPRPRR